MSQLETIDTGCEASSSITDGQAFQALPSESSHKEANITGTGNAQSFILLRIGGVPDLSSEIMGALGTPLRLYVISHVLYVYVMSYVYYDIYYVLHLNSYLLPCSVFSYGMEIKFLRRL